MSATTEKPYARCLTCDLVLPTPDDAQQHRTETLNAALATPGAEQTSHRTQVENPTPEEIAEFRVRREVDDAINDAMESLDRLVSRGVVSEEQVKEALRGYLDFADAWDEFVDEVAR